MPPTDDEIMAQFVAFTKAMEAQQESFKGLTKALNNLAGAISLQAQALALMCQDDNEDDEVEQPDRSLGTPLPGAD